MTRHVAYMATGVGGEMVLAIAHLGSDGLAVLDKVEAFKVNGGDAGIDAVYAQLRAMQDIRIDDHRHRRTDDERDPRTVRERAVAGALRQAAEQ